VLKVSKDGKVQGAGEKWLQREYKCSNQGSPCRENLVQKRAELFVPPVIFLMIY